MIFHRAHKTLLLRRDRSANRTCIILYICIRYFFFLSSKSSRHVRDELIAVRTVTTSRCRAGISTTTAMTAATTTETLHQQTADGRAVERALFAADTPRHVLDWFSARSTHVHASSQTSSSAPLPPPLTCYYFCYTIAYTLYRFTELYSLTAETAVTCVHSSSPQNEFPTIYIPVHICI